LSAEFHDLPPQSIPKTHTGRLSGGWESIGKIAASNVAIAGGKIFYCRFLLVLKSLLSHNVNLAASDAKGLYLRGGVGPCTVCGENARGFFGEKDGIRCMKYAFFAHTPQCVFRQFLEKGVPIW
jgi:hypothetical protein